jgi:hypothetical protein
MSSLKVVKSSAIELQDSSPRIVTAMVSAGPSGVVVGEGVECKPDGSVYVEYPKNSQGPLAARTLIEDVFVGAKVLLAFEMGLSSLPIILGILHDRARTKGRTIHLKADRIILDAKDELSLQCGEASFEARGNGAVHLTGKDVISRATRTNKVRGATVLIN